MLMLHHLPAMIFWTLMGNKKRAFVGEYGIISRMELSGTGGGNKVLSVKDEFVLVKNLLTDLREGTNWAAHSARHLSRGRSNYPGYIAIYFGTRWATSLSSPERVILRKGSQYRIYHECVRLKRKEDKAHTEACVNSLLETLLQNPGEISKINILNED